MTHESKNVIATCKECGGRIWLDIPEKHKCEDWRGGPMDNRERALRELRFHIPAAYGAGAEHWIQCSCGWNREGHSTTDEEWHKHITEALGEARAAIEGEPRKGIEFDLKAAQGLLAFFGGEDTLITVDNGPDGLVAWPSEYPEEGSVVLRAERVLEAAPKSLDGGMPELDISRRVHGVEGARNLRPIQSAVAPLPTAREGLEALLTRYEALPGDDNLSVEFVRQDLRAVKAGTYDPHRR